MENENKKLREIAEKILKRANIPQDEKFGSVIAILMMISIVLTLVRVLQECNKSKTTNRHSQDNCALYKNNIKIFSEKRGWFTRLRIKKVLRRELDSEQYHKYSIKLTEALLDTGEVVTDDEVSTLVEAANV
jgi:hypothetical protein